MNYPLNNHSKIPFNINPIRHLYLVLNIIIIKRKILCTQVQKSPNFFKPLIYSAN